MMKKKLSLTYRRKLVLVYCVTIVLVVAVTSLAFTVTAQRQAREENEALLSVLTELLLVNFQEATAAAERQVFQMISAKNVAYLLYEMEELSPGMDGYYQASQDLIFAINQMITAQTYYDQLYIQSDQGLLFANYYSPNDFLMEAAALLRQEDYGRNTYGRSSWVRNEQGNVYLIRDIYSTSPLRHVGKVVARIRPELLASLGPYNDSIHCAVVFLDAGGAAVTAAGEAVPGMEVAAEEAVRAGLVKVEVDGRPYSMRVHSGGAWTAVGLLPEEALLTMLRSLSQSGFAVALAAALLGTLAVLASTSRLTRQVRVLVKSMDEIAGGNMDLTVPVGSDDELGHLTAHFNRMVGQTRDLLDRVVEEQQRKGKIEYEMLEYKYRSLQSQINPHFIYNAMEAVNALAKIDGNEEICQVVQHISSFFRQNTRNMQKRFITVRQEFESLREYALIYRHIHGDLLSTPFHCEPAVSGALIPTMILQPVLENALVHGIRASNRATVEISARAEGERLIIQVRDNGDGMSPEVVASILQSRPSVSEGESRSASGIGMRNVQSRLRLIYGDRSAIIIDSQPGTGTLVSIQIPLVFSEEALAEGEE